MSESEPGKLTQDEVYDLLSNPRRRFIISHLRGREGPVGLIELAKTVAAWENRTTVEEVTDQQEKRVYVSLYQTHIPKLDDAGIIDYDQETGLITLADNVTALEQYLPTEERDERSFRGVYAALAAVGGLVYLLAVLDVPGFTAASDAVVGGVVVFAFVVATLGLYLYERYQKRKVAIDLARRSDRSENRN